MFDGGFGCFDYPAQQRVITAIEAADAMRFFPAANHQPITRTRHRNIEQTVAFFGAKRGRRLTRLFDKGRARQIGWWQPIMNRPISRGQNRFGFSAACQHIRQNHNWCFKTLCAMDCHDPHLIGT